MAEVTLEAFGVHWFRRDLRVSGNLALKWNLQKTQGRTLGVFFFDSKFLSRPDFSHHRFGFFLQSLKALKTELRQRGGDLWVIDKPPEEGFKWIFSGVSQLPTHVSWNRDYEPFARARDARMLQLFDKEGIQVHTERDHLVIEPHELVKESSDSPFYKVYTPFAKKWGSIFLGQEIQKRIHAQKEALEELEKRDRGQELERDFRLRWDSLHENFKSKENVRDALEDFIQENQKRLTIPLPPAGSLAAFRAVKEFLPKLPRYLEDRDYPAVSGTSKLSIYFKNGSLTPALFLSYVDLAGTHLSQKNGKSQFFKELIWREFYYHILYHRPEVENEAFLTRYKDLEWSNQNRWFEAWKRGQTGYPIVDAGMRQLSTTGWMHNRVRMIVASFLTKDLLIDWQWGEKYFMNQLLDGDLAPNNGGWQWAASTGCDPQPYFRIFNPTLQGKKFDPRGEYIRKFVPELKKKSDKEIHQPSSGYVEPIVDHALQRQRALALFRKLPPKNA